MKIGSRLCLAFVTMAMASSVFAGQTWRWLEGGKWVYGDHFPKNAENPEKVVPGGIEPAAGPAAKVFSNEQAAKQFPVVVYGLACPACDAVKQLLEGRRIVATYKDPSSPALFEEFKKFSPQSMAPVVLVGDRKFIGFEPAVLNGALDDAGYEKPIAAEPKSVAK